MSLLDRKRKPASKLRPAGWAPDGPQGAVLGVVPASPVCGSVLGGVVLGCDLGGPPRFLLASFERGAAPVVLDVQLEDRGMVDEAIDGGHGGGLVGEDLVPFAEGLVGGYEQRAPFVSRRDELEEHTGFGLILLHVGEVVEDQQMVAVEPGELAFESEFAPCHLQALHQIGCAGEEHAVAVLDEGEADDRGKMALPTPGSQNTRQLAP